MCGGAGGGEEVRESRWEKSHLARVHTYHLSEPVVATCSLLEWICRCTSVVGLRYLPIIKIRAITVDDDEAGRALAS